MGKLYIDAKFEANIRKTSEHSYKEESKIRGRTDLEISEKEISSRHGGIKLKNLDFMMPVTYEKFYIPLTNDIFNPECKEVPCIIKAIDGSYDEREIKIRLNDYNTSFQLKISSHFPDVVDIHIQITRDLKPTWCNEVGDSQLMEIFSIAHDSKKRNELERYIKSLNSN